MIRHPDVTAHSLIAALCVNMAQEIYEEICSRSNNVYRANRDRADFIKQCAPTLKAEAKSILGKMLANEHTPQWEKDQIYEALVLDAQMPQGGTSVVKKGSH